MAHDDQQLRQSLDGILSREIQRSSRNLERLKQSREALPSLDLHNTRYSVTLSPQPDGMDDFSEMRAVTVEQIGSLQAVLGAAEEHWREKHYIGAEKPVPQYRVMIKIGERYVPVPDKFWGSYARLDMTRKAR
jgi:hypothetical protein